MTRALCACAALRILIVTLLASTGAHAALFTCEELTPALCPLQPVEGTVDVRGKALVYWIYRADDANPTMLPLVVAHGGPAYPHNYLLPLKQQACRGRELDVLPVLLCAMCSLVVGSLC